MPQNLFGDLIPEGAESYINGIKNECQLSAVLAIHMTWLRYSSDIGKGQRLVPQTALDMLVLYRAAAATFAEWPPRQESLRIPLGGKVANREQAEKYLSCISDERTAKLVALFVQNAIAFSSEANANQDLGYFVELFLRCINDFSVEAIATGAISKRERKPIDLDAIAFDYW